MKYEETCAQGSFKVWGAGFRYEYEAPNKLLNIAPLDEKRAIAHLKFDHHLSRNPLAFVEALNKTNQIHALMFSNNQTVNLADTLDVKRVASLIPTTARVSRFAFDLTNKNYSRFSSAFCKDFDLKSLILKKFRSDNSDTDLFLARMQTQSNNCINVRACTLSGLMSILSESTLSDLITMEFGHMSGRSAHKLLNAASKLSTIARILDENFIPEHKIGLYRDLPQKLDALRVDHHKQR